MAAASAAGQDFGRELGLYGDLRGNIGLVLIFGAMSSLGWILYHWPRKLLWQVFPYLLYFLGWGVVGLFDEGLTPPWGLLVLVGIFGFLHLIYWWDAQNRLAGRPHLNSDSIPVDPEEVSARVSDAYPYPLRILCQMARALTDEGSWALRDYEVRLIRAAAAKLDPANRAALDEQVKASLYVERIHRNRMTLIHFQPRDGVRRMDVPDDYRLAKVTLKLKSKAVGITAEAYNGMVVALRQEARQSVTVSIEAVDGLIRSLAYYSSPKPVVLGDFDIARIEFGGTSDKAVRRSIQRKEFGHAAS